MNSNITSTHGLTHSFGKYTVFRTVHSIYENTNEVAPCIVVFTPCDDMILTTMEYEFPDKTLSGFEFQDVFDTFDYLLKNQFETCKGLAPFDSFAKCEQHSRDNYDWNSFFSVFKKQPLLKFTELIIGNSNNINDEYGVISALYLMCKNPHFAELEDAGFKFIKMR